MWIGVLLVVFGVIGVAGGLFGKTFYHADAITVSQGKEKSSTWSGRLVFFIVGLGLLATGIKLLLDYS